MKITRSSSVKSASQEEQNDGRCPEWDEASKHIKQAIDVLTGPASKGCDISKDAIANLGVVLFDLK